MKFAVSQRGICNRQTFTLPTANQKFAVESANFYFADGKPKICRRQVRRWPSAKFMSDKRQIFYWPSANLLTPANFAALQQGTAVFCARRYGICTRRRRGVYSSSGNGRYGSIVLQPASAAISRSAPSAVPEHAGNEANCFQ